MSDADAKAHAERVERTKDVLERQLADRRKEAQDRRERRMQFNKLLANPALDAATKERMRAEFDTKERELLREARRRISPSDFETLAVIGRGAFGEVMVVRSRDDGHIYAMKKMLKDAMILKNQTGHVMAERTALSEVSEIGDWVVRLHFSFQDEDYLYLVMDMCIGGDLMGLLIKKDVLPEDWVKFYAAEAVMAIGSVHAAGFIHRDIKPDNFLFDHRGHLYLTDLGLCKAVEEDEISEVTAHALKEGAAPEGGLSPPTDSHHERPPAAYVRDRKLAYSTVGTPDYIAYEVLLKKGYGKEVDYWSLGTVLFECLLGFPPFWGSDPVATCRKILRYKESLKFPEDRIRHLSPECIDFLRRLISDAETRLGARGGVEEIKAHPWFRGIDWANLRRSPAPYQPSNGKEVDSLLGKLSTSPKDSPDFAASLKRLTACFDDFSNLPADDPRHAFPGGGHGVAAGGAGGSGGGARKFQRRFVGYTYKRAPDGKLSLPGVGEPGGPSAGEGGASGASTGAGAALSSAMEGMALGGAGKA